MSGLTVGGQSAGAGVTDSQTERVTLATDSPEPSNSSTTGWTFGQGNKVNSSLTVPVPLAPSATAYQSVILVAQKATQGAANTGIVYIGSASGDATALYPMSPGDKLPIDAPPGKKIDLNKIYLDVLNVGDGVTWMFTN